MSENLATQSLLLIRDIMTTPVQTVDLDEPILNAKRLFDRLHFHHVIVLHQKKVFGVVSDRDILKAISPFIGNRMMERSQDANTLKRRVHQVMSRELVTIGPDETAEEAAAKMHAEHVSCLPVIGDDGAPLGIVTVRDFLALAIGATKSDRGDAPASDPDEGICIVIDNRRCYAPNREIARLIRDAEASYQRQHGPDVALAQRLPDVFGL